MDSKRRKRRGGMTVNGRTYRQASPKCPCCQYWGVTHKPRSSRPFKQTMKRELNRELLDE